MGIRITAGDGIARALELHEADKAGVASPFGLGDIENAAEALAYLLGHGQVVVIENLDTCPICGSDHDRITRDDCPEWVREHGAYEDDASW